jgi:uncharacterized protein
MLRRPFLHTLRFAALLALLSGCAVTPQDSGRAFRFANYVAQPAELRGQVFLPRRNFALWGDNRPGAAILIGAALGDPRYAFYREGLLDAGIGVAELDWIGIPEASGEAAAFAALEALRSLNVVAPNRIAIVGIGHGGRASIGTAAEGAAADWGRETGFAAHVALYPGCRRFFTRFRDRAAAAPILLLAGARDSYGDAAHCPGFVDYLDAAVTGLGSYRIYVGAHHAFDRTGAATRTDAAATDGVVTEEYQPDAAQDARATLVSYLAESFALLARRP